MGMLDNLRNFFKGSNNTPVVKEDDSYEKSRLASKIVKEIDGIKRINCFDSNIWNLNNITTEELKRKGLEELKSMERRLNFRLIQLEEGHQRGTSAREELERAKWTGQKPKDFIDHEFDRLQRD